MLEDSTHGTTGVTLPLFPATYASHLLSSSCVSDKLGVLWLSDALRLVFGKSSSTAQGKWLQPSFQRHSSIVVDICYLPFYLRIFNHKERNFPHTLQCSLSFRNSGRKLPRHYLSTTLFLSPAQSASSKTPNMVLYRVTFPLCT